MDLGDVGVAGLNNPEVLMTRKYANMPFLTLHSEIGLVLDRQGTKGVVLH